MTSKISERANEFHIALVRFVKQQLDAGLPPDVAAAVVQDLGVELGTRHGTAEITRPLNVA